MLKLFGEKTQEQRRKSLADYLPDGRPFEAKNFDNTNLKMLLEGLVSEIGRVDEKMNLISAEHDPRTTSDFINEWESALGIPDDCFPGTGSLEERRDHVLIKLGLAIQTEEDFESLAQLFGITVDVKGAAIHGVFPMKFPAIFFDTGIDARYTMLVEADSDLQSRQFTYEFPFTFGPRTSNIVECLFNKLKPANVQNMYRYRL